jgi:hypothetical protein
VVGTVAGIISAFNSPRDVYKSWKDKKKERQKVSQNQELKRSLSAGGATVQMEYDGHFRRLGRLGDRFAIGDGKIYPLIRSSERVCCVNHEQREQERSWRYM